jgi:hypothetical protein
LTKILYCSKTELEKEVIDKVTTTAIATVGALAEAIGLPRTGKILYIDTPVAGEVHYNKITGGNPAQINADPYGQRWLFRIESCGDIDTAYRSLVSAESYIKTLRHTEGFKNPEGIKGGVSGICKAVYSGIGQQKI